jgi:putative solute:sodium symporter small subunit
MPDANSAVGSSAASAGDGDPNSVNFFKPKTAHTRADSRMISIMVVVWAVAVFGFQFLLMATNKPTPEPALKSFEDVWTGVRSGAAEAADQQAFARVTLSVLGKNVALKEGDKDVLLDALNVTVLKLIPDDQQAVYQAALADGAKKAEAAGMAAAAIGLKDTGFDKLRADLLPSSLQAVDSSVAISDKVPEVMKLYLVHPSGPLTEMRFMGFPFHYWYTAQFLLIMFVGLCLTYAIVTDRLNRKYGSLDD